MEDTITLDGFTYTKSAPRPKRYVVVADRGWIFAGDLTEENGRIRLDRAVNLRSYSSVGIDGAVADPKSDSVTIRRMTAPVDMPSDAELFRIPVGDEWGL